ncbi:MAG TPA: HlyD family efflux transporter periplasmic adaptor subunit [Polyangia bacterium]
MSLVAVIGLLLGCGQAPPPGTRVVTVARQDLVLDVEVTGTLKSLEAAQVGPPASVVDTWEFKIARLVPEGARVKVGDEIIAFDPSQLDQKLKEYESEVAAITEELGKLRSERSLESLNDGLALADAEAKQRKAELKADKPEDVTSALALRTSSIDKQLAEREVIFQSQRMRSKRAQESADIAILTGRLRRAEGRVAEIRASIAAMAVKATRAGTVVYKQSWNGEKKKAGDGMWRGESVLEIASLEKMGAVGQVDEVDASKVVVGQRVGLRLEAHPDKEYDGKVARVATLLQTESPESRVKVVTLDITLSATDALLMRPGMRFRGRIEIARLPGVVQVPLAAVESTAAGPVVTKADQDSLTAAGRTRVKLGRRSREAVEVTEGLGPGDRVLVRTAPSGKEAAGFRLGAS